MLLGAGTNNELKIGYVMETDSEFRGLLINAGAGFKYLIGTGAAFRFEYRYTHSRLKVYDEKESFNYHQFLADVSIFF